MLVIDASALIEMLLNTPRAPRIAARALGPGESLHAPHLIDVEVAQVIRRYVRARIIAPQRARQSLDDLSHMPLERYAHLEFVPRIWELRDSITAYDAAYVALAEALQAPLLTCDAKLAAARGHGAHVELMR